MGGTSQTVPFSFLRVRSIPLPHQTYVLAFLKAQKLAAGMGPMWPPTPTICTHFVCNLAGRTNKLMTNLAPIHVPYVAHTHLSPFASCFLNTVSKVVLED